MNSTEYTSGEGSQEMKERGMIFNAEMVRAILDGRKTQTRRIIKPQPVMYEPGQSVHVSDMINDALRCPLGKPGDRLWVRETWGVVSHALDDSGRIIDWNPDRPATSLHEMPFGQGYYSGHAIYRADGTFTWGDDDGNGEYSRWHPSIHMPRAACRILLEITNIRIARLNDISEADAVTEGIPLAGELLPEYPGTYLTPRGDFATAKVAFQRLWEFVCGEESWKANPWVWVIEFKRIEGGAI